MSKGKLDKRGGKRGETEKGKTARTAGIVAGVILIFFAAALFINSNYLRRHSTAISVGEVKLTAAEYSYFYFTSYYDYQNMVYQNLPDLAKEMLPNGSLPLESQIFSAETGQTWADYINDMAIGSIKERAVAYSDAKKNGYALTADDVAEIDGAVAEMVTSAVNYGYGTVDKFLSTRYGVGMTEGIFRKVMEFIKLSDSYTKHVTDAFSYTQGQLDEYYAANNDKLDTFVYRYFFVRSESQNEDDFATTEEYDAAVAEAFEAAKAKSAEYLRSITDEESFIEAARDYDAEAYAERGSTLRSYKGELLGSTYGDWFRDASRKFGDITTREPAASTGSYVLFYIDRLDNMYETVNMRQLVISPETVNSSKYTDADGNVDEEGYEAAQEQAKTDAKTKAESLYKEWTDDGAGEDKLVALMAGNNSDSNAVDGLYENVFDKQINDENVNSWLFYKDRAAGHHALIEGKDNQWYLVYIIGKGPIYHDYLAETELRKADVAAWKAGLGEPEVAKHWTFRFTAQ
ncbi:MAG: hypothetical protein LBN99_04570 [Oscillospiraceae bacterium]|nr:hypothetical protein [Oscillospiraceae bacterium]